MQNQTHDQPVKRCAKCLAPMTDPDWIVNKDMAYCIDCAALLHLGESKESRLFSDMHESRPGGLAEDSAEEAMPPPQAMAIPDPDLDAEADGQS